MTSSTGAGFGLAGEAFLLGERDRCGDGERTELFFGEGCGWADFPVGDALADCFFTDF